MANEYYSILTTVGTEKLAQAIITEIPVRITTIAVGDGNGQYYTPTPDQVSLKRETWRGDINDLRSAEDAANHVLAEGVVPADVGGWTVREVGLFDDTGNLIGICNYPDSIKPLATSGSGKQLYIQVILVVDNVAALELIIDGNIVTASKKYVDQIRKDLAANDGFYMVGHCPDIATLREIEPKIEAQFIDVISYYSGWAGSAFGAFGGGEFVYDNADKVSVDNGGSIIVTKGGARWKRRTEQLLPIHFGAIPGNTTDTTEPLRRYIAASTNRTVDFRGSYWTVSGTLDLTKVAGIVADNSCVFKVNPINFSGSWVFTIGTPDTPAGTGRANRTVLIGSLIVDCVNRSAVLNGVYLKGQWFNIGHIRVSNFNGTGVQQDAVWDSTIDRISVELCGSVTKFAYAQYGAGDTHNTTHIKALQVEQSYHKAIYMTGIRNVIDNIHCERTYILTLNDGTATTPSGLNHTTCFFSMGNSIINQCVIDAATTATAPDGTPCVSVNPSVILSMDYSTMNTVSAGWAIFSCGFGHQAEYNGVVAKDFYVSEPAEKITLRSPRIIGTLYPGSEVIIENGIINKFTPRNNAYNILTNGGVITELEYTTNIRGLITFNNVTFKKAIGDLRAPTGSGANTSIGSLYPPTTFNDCSFTNVNGYFGSMAIFNGGRIDNVHVYSQCAFQFYNTKVGVFDCDGNRAFITRGVQADIVKGWSEPRHYIWPAGTITERVGAGLPGDGLIYICRDSSTINWKAVFSI